MGKRISNSTIFIRPKARVQSLFSFLVEGTVYRPYEPRIRRISFIIRFINIWTIRCLRANRRGSSRCSLVDWIKPLYTKAFRASELREFSFLPFFFLFLSIFFFFLLEIPLTKWNRIGEKKEKRRQVGGRQCWTRKTILPSIRWAPIYKQYFVYFFEFISFKSFSDIYHRKEI